jgi:predicted nuclease of predicted toxin-antitoxin system
MKLLFDENMPFSLAKHLLSHECAIVTRIGWTGTKNGALLAKAELEGFDALVTLDDNIPGEQNMTGRNISVIILKPKRQGKLAVIELRESLELVLVDLQPGSVHRVL